MDWKFLTDEIFELLDSNGLHDGNVDNLEGLVETFIRRVSKAYSAEEEYSEDGLDGEIDFDEPLDIDPRYDD